MNLRRSAMVVAITSNHEDRSVLESQPIAICSSPESRAIAGMDLQLAGILKSELGPELDLGNQIGLYQITRKFTAI